MRVPRPEHAGQAPNGALNEKVRGSISVSCSGWPFGHASFSEKDCHAASPSSSTKLTCTTPPARPERRLDRVGDAAEDVGARHEAVDDDGDVVLVALLQRRRLGELDELAVDDRAGVALGAELAEEVDELALLLADDRRDDLVARALGQLHELVGDLLHRLALDDLAALRAVRHADARPEQAHVVVDLGDRADRRARVAVGRLLVDATPRG